MILTSPLNLFVDCTAARRSEEDARSPAQMETVAAPSSREPPSDPEELRKLIEKVSQPGSSQLHETLPAVPPSAPEFRRKNWGRYAMKGQKAPGLLKIIEWNYAHPVVWINALLAASLAATLICQSQRLSISLLGISLML